jgi:hypothetical protein
MIAKASACGALAVCLMMVPGLVPDAGAREDRFPYSIMAPEPGTASRHHVKSAKPAKHAKTSRARVKLLAKKRKGGAVARRGSSGSVLPTPLPRTTLIPPPKSGIAPVRPLRQDPGPTVVPGLRPIPNLPHGNESFQDRASRCAHQAGLYGVPNDKRTAYFGACL